MGSNFIKTKDIDTANDLRKLGYQEISSNEIEGFVFLNNVSLNFQNNDKVVYTDILYM